MPVPVPPRQPILTNPSMRYGFSLFALMSVVLCFGSGVAHAQEPETAAIAAQPTENADITMMDIPASPLPSYEPTKYVILQTLDKVTARTHTVTVPVGKPTAVGPLFIDVKSCQKTPPTETPESAVFMQIWEAKPKSQQKDSTKQESQWVFSGWMFASSPALSAMNHPIYDVWLKECSDRNDTRKSDK